MSNPWDAEEYKRPLELIPPEAVIAPLALKPPVSVRKVPSYINPASAVNVSVPVAVSIKLSAPLAIKSDTSTDILWAATFIPDPGAAPMFMVCVCCPESVF